MPTSGQTYIYVAAGKIVPTKVTQVALGADGMSMVMDIVGGLRLAASGGFPLLFST